ncbi:hypothetical protein MBM_03574 [Drepanopeziza brunnea f. sp. 'multigermtubi' MB_m1]|uniref:Uncharacterized protein n=1 Tax=Marssonina brunnea f. sp. multigermtubi (strain MB_m1) TaxID=1072389 RepID=K1X081_MARBU|nr:uncharacterized protein MBM_03574 [Drepanopeziza brunnea f. sp. 'multigermtubi' MB_m1]EKD18581.1 hypothetical protein MBM_03574 [Drepanopeziza brunnea f. sp. 'multigermtubi' MB_m1]
MQFFFKSRGRGRLRNPFFALAIITAAVAAATAAILRTFTFEASLSFLDFSIKRLLMLTTVKALSNYTVAFAAANTAFDNFLALDAALLKGAASSPESLASGNGGFKSSFDSFAGFAFAFKTFNLNIAFIKLNSLMAANRSPVTRSASSILLFPALALALAAFVAPVAFIALVASVVLIIVALFALIVALAALAAALAIAITLAERRAKVKRLLKALVDLLL